MKAFLQKNRISILLVTIMIVGIGLIAYPSIANYWNSFHQSQAIMDYQKSVSAIDTSQYEKILSSAKKYNEKFKDSGINWHMTDKDRDAYNKELAIDQTGNMGFISIPKINVTLPLYHGTSEDVLLTSIGHIEGTSLPVGGVSTHSVLSGHRGLPSSRLFTDLDKLKVGDRWTVSILNESYTYEVDQIRTVLPTDLSNIQIEEGMDYQTLVTCTPYGINTHRLLVRGHRVSNEDGDGLVTPDAIQIEPIYIAPFIGVPIVLILFIIFMIESRKHRKRRQILKKLASSEEN